MPPKGWKKGKSKALKETKTIKEAPKPKKVKPRFTEEFSKEIEKIVKEEKTPLNDQTRCRNEGAGCDHVYLLHNKRGCNSQGCQCLVFVP